MCTPHPHPHFKESGPLGPNYMLLGGGIYFGTEVRAEEAPDGTEGRLLLKAGFTQSQAAGGPDSCTGV